MLIDIQKLLPNAIGEVLRSLFFTQTIPGIQGYYTLNIREGIKAWTYDEIELYVTTHNAEMQDFHDIQGYTLEYNDDNVIDLIMWSDGDTTLVFHIYDNYHSNPIISVSNNDAKKDYTWVDGGFNYQIGYY
jgi:hypothetical protein